MICSSKDKSSGAADKVLHPASVTTGPATSRREEDCRQSTAWLWSGLVWESERIVDTELELDVPMQ
jgi:hypothetical protein